MTLREKLIVLRDKAGITQMALAHQLGVSRQAVTRWESGDTAPSMDKLKALAKIYDVSLDWLCSEADEPYENKEKSESIRLDEDEQKAEPYDMRNKRTSVKRTVIVCAVVLAALIFACVVFVKARQKAKSIEKSLDSNQSMIYYMNPENFLVSIGGRYLQKALDLVDASCDFDNEEFISILESAVQAGCYEATYDPNETGQQKVIRGKLICFFSGLMTGQDVAFDREECGQTLSYIGWPTVDGSNGTDIRLTQAVGINKATKNIEGCWEFVKYLLKNPILIDNASGMPTYAPLVNEDLKMLNSGEPKFKTTEEDMEIVINLAKESEQLTYYDEEVMNIILNESSAFIQGNTSASETAKRIQSRVSLYMKEQYE